MIKILKPKEGHDNTFRELLDLWSENGFCTVEESADNFCWASNQGEILLYDYPRLDDREIPKFKFGLFGNTVPVHEKTSPWIFWGRKPRQLEKARNKGILPYSERNIDSIFLGKIENPIQFHNRNQHDWSTAVEVFNCPTDKPGENYYKYTQQEYLEKLSKSKFGLCLAGYGPKCNREIELIGMGVVPLFTPQVDCNYHEPLVENVHFLRVESPEDLTSKINNTKESDWNRLQKNGQEWFERNCSTKGSFDTTLKIISSIK